MPKTDKAELNEDDTDALLEAIEHFKDQPRQRNRTSVDIFTAGFYYGVVHGRGKKPADAPPPAAPEDAPAVEGDDDEDED